MAAKHLSKCLDISYGIPTDVRFLFKDGTEVKAHKVFLAVVSDVFKREFYGLMKKEVKGSEEDIDIVDATQEVFNTMVEFVYNKDLDWNAFDFHIHCSLYYLAEKYNIVDLKSTILSFIADNQLVNMENVMEVACLAEENSHHEPLSDLLYQNCVSCLEGNFQGSYNEVVKFCADSELYSEAYPRVFPKLMKQLSKSFLTCSNCSKLPCIDGAEPTAVNFKSGARVRKVGGIGFDITKLCRILEDPATFFGIVKNDDGGSSKHVCTFGKGYYFYKCK
eukprot:GFUD01017382.1.p1 GENE.GFUD01017382.1~~GFUD01017382.1.p1  ORF type:complete len:277 (-),score=58.96 GFUD01017382.1:27-857(-)